MSEARPFLLKAEERPKVELSPQSGWRRTLAMVIASAFALALHGGVVLVLLFNFSLFVPDPSEESEDLEQQIIAIVEIPPQQPAEPAVQEAAIDIGRVNQGEDTGEGEAAATGELASEEPEPAETQPEPPSEEPPPEESPEEVAAPEEPPIPDSPLFDPLAQEAQAPAEVPLPEVPLPEAAEALLPEPEEPALPLEPEQLPPPLTGPPSELPEFALLDTQQAPREILDQVPEEPIEDLTLDAALTEVLVTAAIEREAEVSGPSGPLAVPPGKPDREVTLPPVPRPQRTARAEPRDRDTGRQARNDSSESGDGGGYGGGSEANYLGQVARVLNRQKIYPPEAKIRGEEGRVIVRFTLDEEGWVIARRVLRSSGSSRLDEEVMGLLIRASPLPPPPGRPERLTLTLTLRFYLG